MQLNLSVVCLTVKYIADEKEQSISVKIHIRLKLLVVFVLCFNSKLTIQTEHAQMQRTMGLSVVIIIPNLELPIK